MSQELPIFGVRGAFEAAVEHGPVVLSSPTGSGKSTEVPRWCRDRVLVIEPRRIACRSLASRVAELERTRVGDGVGYVVRDERVLSDDTRIVFATPGIALRDRALLGSARTVILDEFHERSLEVDLLLALLLRERRDPRERALVVMSATLEGERVARHVGGVHLEAEGRAFPVDVRYLPGSNVLPHREELAQRIVRALDAAATESGDVLVFLPGKAEIEACAQALRTSPWSAVPLHGGLALDEQRRAFERTPRRKVILATNVAETSLTIPGIGVVIDAGLVRQTRYHDGRGFLALVPIAEDSAKQRAGRAGRTGPGVCYRLWSAAARLAPVTLPEIHRESLVPLVLGALAWGVRVEELSLLDAPRQHALDAARADLGAWEALDSTDELTASGRALFSLPVAPEHARLLTSARAAGCLDEMVDLVAALEVGRPLFLPGAPSDDVDELRRSGCDATALVRAVRAERPSDHGLSASVLADVRHARARLRRIEGLPERADERRFDREALIRAAISSDPRRVHVARTRGRDTFFSNGGTELELARESAVANVEDVQALVVLDTRALGEGLSQRVLVTAGMAIPLSAIARAGLGRDQLGAVTLEGKRVVATLDRVYAKRVVAQREEVPTGALAREALKTLLLRGSVFRAAVAETRARLERTTLAIRLGERGHPAGIVGTPVSLEDFLTTRLASLGVESGEDLAMLSASDFLAEELPVESRAMLDREFPASVSVGDASYRASYDLDREQVTLELVSGSRKEPPPLAYLPRFAGLRIAVTSPRGTSVLRERGAR